MALRPSASPAKPVVGDDASQRSRGPAYLVFVLFAIAAALWFGLCGLESNAVADGKVLASAIVPAGQWTQATRRELAMMCDIESSNRPDQEAIAHAIFRWWTRTRVRQRWTFQTQIVRYSRVLVAHHAGLPGVPALDRPFSPRQLRIFARPSAQAFEVVDAWAAGAGPDPCPRSFHWRARRPGETGRGTCTEDTNNKFQP